jgi:hypothetical protein
MGNPASSRNPRYLLSLGVSEGYAWEVTHNGMGYRCGYLRVPAGHPWHGKDESLELGVHGGVTFARADTQDGTWWIGFDCAHYGDAPDPGLPRAEPDMDLPRLPGEVQDTTYAEVQCLLLAAQAREAAARPWLAARTLTQEELMSSEPGEP